MHVVEGHTLGSVASHAGCTSRNPAEHLQDPALASPPVAPPVDGSGSLFGSTAAQLVQLNHAVSKACAAVHTLTETEPWPWTGSRTTDAHAKRTAKSAVLPMQRLPKHWRLEWQLFRVNAPSPRPHAI